MNSILYNYFIMKRPIFRVAGYPFHRRKANSVDNAVAGNEPEL